MSSTLFTILDAEASIKQVQIMGRKVTRRDQGWLIPETKNELAINVNNDIEGQSAFTAESHRSVESSKKS